MTSIRSKIVFTLVAALIVAGIVTSWATYYSTRTEFAALFDEQLKHVALELTERGDTGVNNAVILGNSDRQSLVVQIYDARSNRLYLSHKRSPLPISETVGFGDFELASGQQWRQYTSAVGTKIIQVAQPKKVYSDLAVDAAVHILQPMLVLIPFLAIAIWFITVQALQPLSRTARAVALRSPSSLKALPSEDMPTEVKGLVTALNTLLERLEVSLSAQQRFASDAAHELRTPLAAIKLQAQLLSRAKTPEDQAKYAGRLNQGVARATRLVEQLLTIARLDPDAAEKPLAEVELSNLAQGSVEDLELTAASKNITLTCSASPVTMMGMSDALRLLITNITDNAIRYTPEGGRIEVGVKPEGSFAVITVTDNGPGIAPEERTRVFERFYRALGTKVSGTGLGLAIVSRIVQMHAGTIAIEDGFERPNPADEKGNATTGHGAKFVVRLPQTPPLRSIAYSDTSSGNA